MKNKEVDIKKFTWSYMWKRQDVYVFLLIFFITWNKRFLAINFLELERQNCKKSHDNINNFTLPESVENESLSFSLCFVCGSNQERHQPARIKQETFGPTTIIDWIV